MKRKLPPKIPIPRKGLLHWTNCYAEVGDELKVYPFFGSPFLGKVTKVRRNNFGRVSYVLGNRHALTEELTPQHHKRCER